ncbi:hypothetical protein ACFE04_024263 [Oxalis oulophora]
MGALCCVAARPHGSDTSSRDCPVVLNQHHWQNNDNNNNTNTNISSPRPIRSDFRFQSQGLPYGLRDGNNHVYRSSTSNSHLYGHQQYSSDGTPLFSGHSDRSQDQYWPPPAIQETGIHDFEYEAKTDSVMRQISFRRKIERTIHPDSVGSTSSRSDSSESDPIIKSRSSSHRNFSNRRHFMSKPIHPLSFTSFSHGEPSHSTAVEFSDIDTATPPGDAHRWSSGSSSFDFLDVTEAFDSDIPGGSRILSDALRCGLCEKLLSQRSPWSSSRIVRSEDMPTTAVLPCRHVYHVECLEQTTPKIRRTDPPCPICEEGTSQEQRSFAKLRYSFPKLKPLSEPWGCTQVGDCVEGALHASPRNSMSLLNRNRLKKNLSFRAYSGKEFPAMNCGALVIRVVEAFMFYHLVGKGKPAPNFVEEVQTCCRFGWSESRLPCLVEYMYDPIGWVGQNGLFFSPYLG